MTSLLDHPVRLSSALLMFYPALNHVGIGPKNFLLPLCLPAAVGAAQWAVWQTCAPVLSARRCECPLSEEIRLPNVECKL